MDSFETAFMASMATFFVGFMPAALTIGYLEQAGFTNWFALGSGFIVLLLPGALVYWFSHWVNSKD